MILALLTLAACGPTTPPPPLDESACSDASARLGETVCLHRIETRAHWDTVATDADVVDQDKTTKYLVPVSDAEALPTMFVNANVYALHYDFLREVFPELFGTMTWEQYAAMLVDLDVRRYFGGNVSEYIEVDGSRRFGFIVWDRPEQLASTVTYEEVLAVWTELQDRFRLGALMFAPNSSNQRAAATTAEAEAFWQALRPDPVTITAADLSATAPVPLLDVPTATRAERDTAMARYGVKGTNLATLYQRIDPDVQVEGLVLPFSWYTTFVEGNSWEVDGETLTFQQTLDAWLVDPTFLTDGEVRAARLTALREAMATAPVAPEQIATLEAAIHATWGSDTTMVRLRSSSNAEDGVVFSGAGLYDSVSACVADEEDADADGPSLCDPDKDNERPLSDALRGVWASLWKGGAYEEREWYGIDQRLVAMAVLVNTQSEDEQANIVGFTGHPTLDDPRWLVESQLGDLDVVGAEPGVWPEQVLLTLADGAVTHIDRVSLSSEADLVLSDARLEALGALLWDVAAVFPVDDAAPEGGTLMLDTECKILEDGRLIIKQVRPFVRG